jgi:hypothetical protein
MDDEGNIINLPHCDVNGESVTVGYIWKELFDGNATTARVGVTIGKTSDHNPHFHNAPECYYVTVGKSKTLAQNQFFSFEEKQYFYIPANAIHNTPILEEYLGVFYWFPALQSFEAQESLHFTPTFKHL